MSFERSARLLSLHPHLRIRVGSDVVNVEFKAHLIDFLQNLGHDVDGSGTDSLVPAGSLPMDEAGATTSAGGDVDLGIVLGGSGASEPIAANWVRSINAKHRSDLHTSVVPLHNDVDVLLVAARVVTIAVAEEMVTAWLERLATPVELCSRCRRRGTCREHLCNRRGRPMGRIVGVRPVKTLYGTAPTVRPVES